MSMLLLMAVEAAHERNHRPPLRSVLLTRRTVLLVFLPLLPPSDRHPHGGRWVSDHEKYWHPRTPQVRNRRCRFGELVFRTRLRSTFLDPCIGQQRLG